MSEHHQVFQVSKTERSDKFIDIYANFIRLGVGPTDFTITFGAVDDMGLNNLIGKDLAAIRLSPQTFKLLTLQLAQAVHVFEARSGVVILPKEDNQNTQEQPEPKKKRGSAAKRSPH